MDNKVIIAIVAAVVVLGAVGGGAAFFLMNKDDDKHNSDFTLMDSISTDGIKGGLYYIYDSSEKGFSTTIETVTAEETKSNDIHCSQTTDSTYDNYKDLFDVDRFKTLYFDFTDPSATPTGVTCNHTSSWTGTIYEISGTGSKTVDTGSVTMTFTDVKITVADGDCNGASGSASVKGDYEINYNKFKYDIQETYSTEMMILGYATTSGTIHSEVNMHFTSVDQYKAVVFMPVDVPAKLTPTKENHRGVEADKYVIDETIESVAYKVTAFAYKGYMMDASGTVNGDDVSANVQIYYI